MVAQGARARVLGWILSQDLLTGKEKPPRTKDLGPGGLAGG
jgi:hypothetical protein